MADLQPGQNIKHLRRDQLLDNYEASAKTLQTLIRAKESEVAYRKDLIRMHEESKAIYDSKLAQSKQDYQTVKGNLPASIDIKAIARLDSSILNERSTTPPMPPPPSPPAKMHKSNQSESSRTSHMQAAAVPSSSSSSISNDNHHNQMLAPPLPIHPLMSANQPPGTSTTQSTNNQSPVLWTPNSSHSSTRSSDFDNIPFPSQDNHENRTSLDRRLSEFLKTFPNISQPGLVPPTNIDTTKPPPGYYTQQNPQAMVPPPPSLPLPQPAASMSVHHQQQPQQHHNHHHHHHHQRR